MCDESKATPVLLKKKGGLVVHFRLDAVLVHVHVLSWLSLGDQGTAVAGFRTLER